MAKKLRFLLLVVVVAVSLVGIIFFSSRDLDQTVSFQLPPRGIDIVTVGEIDSPVTSYTVMGGVKSFFQEPVNQVVVGRHGDVGSYELGLIGFSAGKTYFATEKLGWSSFQRINRTTVQNQTFTVTLGKDETMTLVICTAIFLAGFVLSVLIFKISS